MEKGTEIKEATARAHAFYQKWSKFSGSVGEFFKELNELRENVVSLCNLNEHLRHEVRQSEIAKAKVEEQARMRLENVQKGQKALIDRLSKKELELANKLKDIETKNAIYEKKNRELELLKTEYERRLDSMTEIEKAGKKK